MLLPLWTSVFSELGFEVVVSNPSTRKTYEKGQFSIPSDTACYPAKIMHGHMVELVEKGVSAIFYPRITYNLPEDGTDNKYNCPVVAYYSDLLRGNMDELKTVRFLYPFLNINNQKELAKELYNLGFFNPEMADQAIMCLEMMSFEGKEQVIERIRSNSSGAFYEGNIPHENQAENITSSDESYLVKAFKDTFPGKTTLSEARRVRGI